MEAFLLALFLVKTQATVIELGSGYQYREKHGYTTEGDTNADGGIQIHHIGDRLTTSSSAIFFRAFLGRLGAELTLGEHNSAGMVYRFGESKLVPEFSIGVSEASISVISNAMEQNVKANAAFAGIGANLIITKNISINVSYKYTSKASAQFNSSTAEWNERYSFMGFAYRF